ncbi:hypothetical protein Geu3261_0093_015 [Komagataeibacter europaeus NBRC 3261]|uniref:Uncharacterized protein n=1 Tax=Komagataeibacter europaeus NBRC 3261 TaxID=1234669 RepID=A0A0D6PZL2_KOMEU|nr:hypothetical protein [Komagataeibacter europaeus]GAN96732.1 hypothetical protein Geu3261_0093_015 [Komagataeibacter europaeus NBRC 3261]
MSLFPIHLSGTDHREDILRCVELAEVLGTTLPKHPTTSVTWTPAQAAYMAALVETLGNALLDVTENMGNAALFGRTDPK